MAFYIFPPKGTISLEKLYHVSVVRMKFLLEVCSCHGNSAKMRDLVGNLEVAEDSDILIEDSDKDCISHYCLRMACLQDSQLQEFFIEAETLLFAYRLSCMQQEELLNAIKPLRKLLVKAETAKHKLHSSLVDVCHMIMYILHARGWSNLIGCYFGESDHEFINIPFQFVDDLVARRCVELRCGVAAVPVSKLCDLLVMLFRRLLEYSVYKAWEETQLYQEKDRRMLALFLIVTKLLRKSGLHGGHREFLGTIMADQVDSLSDAFPPCMALLHKRLRTTHRLPHHARIRYTLFLKEAGLPLNEALQFWREEYSKPSLSSNCHDNDCSHNWQEDARRYTYNIRHLYGLEGSRKNYRGHSCGAVQERCSTTESVGCPFKHFDKENLQQVLQKDVSPDKIQLILKLSSDGDFARCCSIYRKYSIEKALNSSASYQKVGRSDHGGKSGARHRNAGMSDHASQIQHNEEAKVDVKIEDIKSYSPLCYVASVKEVTAYKTENEKVEPAPCRSAINCSSDKMLSNADSTDDWDGCNVSNGSVELFDSTFDETATECEEFDQESQCSCNSECPATCQNCGTTSSTSYVFTQRNDVDFNHCASEQLRFDPKTASDLDTKAQNLTGRIPKRIKLEYEPPPNDVQCVHEQRPEIKEEPQNTFSGCESLHCKMSESCNEVNSVRDQANGRLQCKDSVETNCDKDGSKVESVLQRFSPPNQQENLQRIYKPVDYYVGYRKLLEKLKLL